MKRGGSCNILLSWSLGPSRANWPVCHYLLDLTLRSHVFMRLSGKTRLDWINPLPFPPHLLEIFSLSKKSLCNDLREQFWLCKESGLNNFLNFHWKGESNSIVENSDTGQAKILSENIAEDYFSHFGFKATGSKLTREKKKVGVLNTKLMLKCLLEIRKFSWKKHGS